MNPDPQAEAAAHAALAHALERWFPGIENHEIEHIRAGLREQGHDVVKLEAK